MRSRVIAIALVALALGCDDGASAAPVRAEAPPPESTAPEPAPPPPDPEPPTVRISAAGDLVLNPHAMRAIEDDGDDGYANLLRGYAASVRDDEIAYVNLEQPLVNDLVALDPGWPRQDTRRPRRSPVLGATPPLAGALAATGVDVAGLANNHAYDQGRAGLARTVELLSDAGVLPLGAGADADAAYAPLIVERDRARVAFLAFSDFFNQHPGDDGAAAAYLGDEARAIAAIAAARERADLVVAAVHWSRDFEEAARQSERETARRLVEAGADLVLGTGPHVLHEVERLESPRGDAVVAYSLGNVASGMGRSYRVGRPPHDGIHPANVRPEARDGLVLRVALELGERVTVTELSGVPLWTRNNWLDHVRDENGTPHRVEVIPLADARDEVRAERLPIVRAAVGDAVTLAIAPE